MYQGGKVTMKMEEAHSSETWYLSTKVHHIIEGHNLHLLIVQKILRERQTKRHNNTMSMSFLTK
jgi:hypothetical protein